MGTLLLAVRDWQLHVISGLAFALGALMYYVILYQIKPHPPMVIRLGCSRRCPVTGSNRAGFIRP